MSENTSEQDEDSQVGISDDKLPEDLQPSDDNPLAKELDDGTAGDLEPGELLEEGKKPDQWDDEELED